MIKLTKDSDVKYKTKEAAFLNMSKKTKIYNYTCTKNSEELTRCQRSSCWAFSTTGSTEGAWQIGTGNLLSVSEQQLVDCATATSSGCQGGSMAGAIQHKSGTAMATEASYPYTARDGTCKSSFTAAIPNGGITGYKSVGNIFPGASKAQCSRQSSNSQCPSPLRLTSTHFRLTRVATSRPAAAPTLIMASSQWVTCSPD